MLAENLPAYRIILLTGLDNVDKWTDQKLWDATLKDVDVVVGTPAVLLDSLTHGFVKISNIALLVFDEAHHATKAHPMASIMRLFYHPASKQGQPVPAILGLSKYIKKVYNIKPPAACFCSVERRSRNSQGCCAYQRLLP